jgi:hypothetical protein
MAGGATVSLSLRVRRAAVRVHAGLQFAAVLDAWRDRRDRQAFQRTARDAARTPAPEQAWQWDDPAPVDLLAVWIGADTASIDAAFLVIADVQADHREAAAFAAILRGNAPAQQGEQPT